MIDPGPSPSAPDRNDARCRSRQPESARLTNHKGSQPGPLFAFQEQAITEASTQPAAGVETNARDSLVSLIVFGLDDGGKPHASRFSQADTELATKAAGLMGMRTLAIETDEHRALAAQLPQGRVFASGKGFVPFVKKGLYDRLSTLAGPATAASDTLKAARPDGTAQRPGGDVAAEEHRPTDWTSIIAGSTVLVHGGGEDGWFEAKVVEVKTENLLVLRWRDWPELPVLVRTLAHVALLSPAEPTPTVEA